MDRLEQLEKLLEIASRLEAYVETVPEVVNGEMVAAQIFVALGGPVLLFEKLNHQSYAPGADIIGDMIAIVRQVQIIKSDYETPIKKRSAGPAQSRSRKRG